MKECKRIDFYDIYFLIKLLPLFFEYIRYSLIMEVNGDGLFANFGEFSFGLIKYFVDVTNELFLVLVAVVALDYITGVAAAVHSKQISSKIGVKGISKKVMIFAIVSLSNLIDRIISAPKPADGTLQTLTTLFYICNESISVMENAASAGINVPKIITDIMTKLKNNR